MKSHKELIRDYREQRFAMGVLQIVNTTNGKRWLDAGVNLPALENRHRFSLDMGSHDNRELQADWNRLGSQAFCFEVLGTVAYREDFRGNYRDEVLELLELYLEDLQPYGDRGYHQPR